MRNKMRESFSLQVKKAAVILLSALLLLSVLTACGSDPAESSTGGGTAGNEVSGTGQSDNAGTGNGGTGQSGSAGSEGSGTNPAIDDAFIDDGFEPVWAGTQFYNGEEIVILRKENGSEDEKKGQNIYLKDSLGISRRIVSGVPKEYKGTWFYTYEGYCLAILDNRLVRIEADGTEKFDLVVENGVKDIVQLDDGTIVLLMRDTEGVYRLAVLDPEEATFAKVPGEGYAKDKRLYISADGNKVVLLNRDGFWNVNLQTGELTSRMPISEYDYTVAYNIKAFRMLGGGGVHMLFQNSKDVLLPADIEKYKTMVEVLAPDSDWIKEWLICFNKHSEAYYAELVPFEREENAEDTQKKLLKMLEMGIGADVVFGECFDNVPEALASGYLENLTPYMKNSGVYEEDFFPGTFDDFKVDGQIYGTYITTGTSGWSFSEEVLGGRNVPDLQGLVNALLAYTEPAVLYRDAPGNLKYFLSASESLAGSVDWDNLTCNFHNNLFAGILEVSKLYSRTGNELPMIADSQVTTNFYSFETEEQLRLANQVYVGYLFDNGAHPATNGLNEVYINKNSTNKDGAWAVLEFLLSEEFQLQNDIYMDKEEWYGIERIPNVYRSCPVNLYVFDEIVKMEMEETSIMVFEKPDWTIKIYKASMAKKYMDLGDVGYRGLHDLKEQEAEEMLERLYQARPKPTKTLDLQEIIYEEAIAYFIGERSLGDTCDAIQQRAQAYLDGLK